MRIIAIGDIHGCIISFENLLDKINLSKSDKLILLGDYVDRGPSSKQVLDKIIELNKKDYNLITLLGNHEKMLLDSFYNINNESLWMLNGGDATLRSFETNAASNLDKKYIDLISSMKFYYEHINNVFVHAGFSEEDANPLINTDAMVWTRKESYAMDFFNQKKVVHGHTPQPLSYLEKQNLKDAHVINIDTGCVYSDRPGFGYLTAFDITNIKLYSVYNSDMTSFKTNL